jgi:hypothetical protein
MAATLFDQLITQGVRSGQIPSRTQQARDWYRDIATEVKSGGPINQLFRPGNPGVAQKTGFEGPAPAFFNNLNNGVLAANQSRFTNFVSIGSMYMFNYDAKWKDTLPYWDARPLVFPFKLVPGGFYGINLHYLPLEIRAALMDELYKLTNNTRFDESTVIAANYQLLMASAKTRVIKECVKHYLVDHVRSSFTYIYPSEWDIALFLPVAKWQKGSPY